MHEPSLVSSIIIFLNEERFVGEAIESVLSQSYPHWELLLVDDGSSDGSTALAQRYAASYPKRIRYLEHPGHANRGMSASRNLGISQARGEYLAFLDADDIWLPHKLERQVATLQTFPAASMVCSRTLFWYSWSGKAEDKDRDTLSACVKSDILVAPPTLFRLFVQRRISPPGICNVLVRHEAVEMVGGFEETFRGMYEDQVFFAKLCLQFPVFVASDFSAKYRQHSESCCNLAQKAGHFHPDEPNEARRIYLEWIVSYLRQVEGQHGCTYKLVQKELWPYRHPGIYRQQARLKQLLRKKMPGAFYHWLLQRWRQFVTAEVT
jgi:glycosyltransferase involved in cell wall biosynthesis